MPAGSTDDDILMLADMLPTGYEVGVLSGMVRAGDVVAVVGAGPIGLSAIMGARLFSPSHIVAIDLADSRLDAAKQFGADVVVNNSREDAGAVVAGLTGGLGADVAIVGFATSRACGAQAPRTAVVRGKAGTAPLASYTRHGGVDRARPSRPRRWRGGSSRGAPSPRPAAAS